MIKKGKRIPFDIAGIRAITFDIDLVEGTLAREALYEQVKLIDEGMHAVFNPLASISNYSVIQKAIESKQLDFSESNISEVVIESLKRMENSMSEIGFAITEMKRDISIPKEPTIVEIRSQADGEIHTFRVTIEGIDGYGKQFNETILVPATDEDDAKRKAGEEFMKPGPQGISYKYNGPKAIMHWIKEAIRWS